MHYICDLVHWEIKFYWISEWSKIIHLGSQINLKMNNPCLWRIKETSSLFFRISQFNWDDRNKSYVRENGDNAIVAQEWE